MKVKTIIFDMDGLLIDSQWAWNRALAQFLASKRLVFTDKIRKRLPGTGNKEAIEIFKQELGLSGKTEVLVGEMRKHFFKVFLQEPKLMEGVIETVNNFKKKNYSLSVATSTGPRNRVVEMLNGLKIKKYFQLIVTGDEVSKGKPSPDIYLFSAKKLGVMVSGCLVLEDAVNGVLAGKQAGMMGFRRQ